MTPHGKRATFQSISSLWLTRADENGWADIDISLRLDHPRTYPLNDVVAISLLRREVATKIKERSSVNGIKYIVSCVLFYFDHAPPFSAVLSFNRVNLSFRIGKNMLYSLTFKNFSVFYWFSNCKNILRKKISLPGISASIFYYPYCLKKMYVSAISLLTLFCPRKIARLKSFYLQFVFCNLQKTVLHL